MKQKLPLFFFISAVMKLVASQYDECYPNEIFTPSVNPCNTCDVRGYCPEYSGPGCDCVSGLFRNSYGSCVPPEDCDGPYNTNYNRKVYPTPEPKPVCGLNEEYTDCGTLCPPTCKFRVPVCLLQCIKGCSCRRGYVLKDGRCVDPQECEVPPTQPPRLCGANEIFLDCGSACPPTCQITQQACSLQCVRGCFCITGYVRKNGICVLPQACNENPPPPSYPGSGPIIPRQWYPQVEPSIGPITIGTPVRATPTPPTPQKFRGCPKRNSCNRYCRSIGSAAGFCVGPNFLKCNCVG